MTITFSLLSWFLKVKLSLKATFSPPSSLDFDRFSSFPSLRMTQGSCLFTKFLLAWKINQHRSEFKPRGVSLAMTYQSKIDLLIILYRIIAVYTMSYITIDSFSLPPKRTPDQLTRNASSVNSNINLKHHKAKIQAPINKTISNYFFKPQKIPPAIEDKAFYKNNSSKPFFAKNRKLLDSKNKTGKGIACPVIVPMNFKNMLRAKSTVIKQKKLQEYYINREGRKDEIQRMVKGQLDIQNTKGNLFRTNFTQKKVKRRINSMTLEKNSQEKAKNKCHELYLLDSKIITIQSLTEDFSQVALKEKETYNNYQPQKKYESSIGQATSIKANWRSFQKRNRPALDKQNVEFTIDPWGSTENEDVFF